MSRPLQLHCVCIVVLLLLSSFIPSLASTYYISSSRGNDGASGTSEQSPWRSLARLRLVSLQPGDVVLLQRGDVWYEDLILDRLHGTPAQPIRIADFGSGNKPLLQPQRASQVLSLSHAHHVHVKNLHLKASSGKKAVRIAGDARFVTVTHCRMEGHPDGNSNHGIVYAAISQGYKPTFPVIEHNEVTFFRESIIGIGGVNQGGRVAYNYVHSAVPTDGTDLIRAIGGDFQGLSIAHNHLTGWYDDAIDLYTGSNVVVEYNRVHSPGQPVLGSGNAIKLGGVTNQVAKAPTSYGNVARYNLIYDLMTRPAGKLSNGIDTNGGYNASIYGNLIYNVKGNAISVSTPGCRVFNNTAISERVGLYFNGKGIALQAYNNILSGARDVQAEHASARITGSNNLLVHDKAQGNYLSQNDRSGNPGFQDPGSFRFALKPNSIAINAGVAMSDYKKGRQNNQVTGRPDMGCHEYTGQQSAPPEPTPQPSPTPEPKPQPAPAPQPEPTPVADGALNYSYYEGNWNKLPDFSKLKAKKKGTVDNFSLKPRQRNENFAFRFTGFITITQAGTYTFYTKSDDGSKLFLNGKTVVDNDGIHAAKEKSGKVYLPQGQHPITVTFFERTAGEVLEVRYAGPGTNKQIVPASVLSRSGPRNPEPQPAPAPNPEPTPVANGALNYSYYEGAWKYLPDFSQLKAKKTGTADNFSLQPRERNDNFALVFKGFINITQAGTYTFYTKSDDGSKLYINGQTVVKNDGVHPVTERAGKVYLSKGKHPITVAFFERTVGEVLEVRYAGPGINKQIIPTSVLSISGMSKPAPAPKPEPTPAPAPTANGALNYSYYEGNWNKLPDFSQLKAKKKGTVDNFSLKPRQRNENFAFRFTGFITITQAGTYTFYTKSDDGSKLFLNGKTVVDNDGIHAAKEKSGKVYLPQGQHPITVTFFERTAGEVLEVRYAGPGTNKQIVPASVLSVRKKGTTTSARSVAQESRGAAQTVTVAGADYLINTYPNPVRDRLSVSLEGTPGETVILRVMNSVGRSVLSKEVMITQLEESVVLDVHQYLPKAGMFYLVVEQPSGKRETIRLIKQ